MTNLHNLATVLTLRDEDECHLVLLRTFCGEHLHDMLRPQGYIEEQSTDNASHTPPQNCYSECGGFMKSLCRKQKMIF